MEQLKKILDDNNIGNSIKPGDKPEDDANADICFIVSMPAMLPLSEIGMIERMNSVREGGVGEEETRCMGVYCEAVSCIAQSLIGHCLREIRGDVPIIRLIMNAGTGSDFGEIHVSFMPSGYKGAMTAAMLIEKMFKTIAEPLRGKRFSEICEYFVELGALDSMPD